MALNSFFCADVPLRNYSFTHDIMHIGWSSSPCELTDFSFCLLCVLSLISMW